MPVLAKKKMNCSLVWWSTSSPTAAQQWQMLTTLFPFAIAIPALHCISFVRSFILPFNFEFAVYNIYLFLFTKHFLCVGSLFSFLVKMLNEEIWYALSVCLWMYCIAKQQPMASMNYERSKIRMCKPWSQCTTKYARHWVCESEKKCMHTVKMGWIGCTLY